MGLLRLPARFHLVRKRNGRLTGNFNFLAYYACRSNYGHKNICYGGWFFTYPSISFTARGFFDFGYFRRVKGREKARIFHRFKAGLFHLNAKSVISNYRVIWEQEKNKKLPGRVYCIRLKRRVKKGRVLIPNLAEIHFELENTVKVVPTARSGMYILIYLLVRLFVYLFIFFGNIKTHSHLFVDN